MPPERGRKPFQPTPCMFHATLPPSCSVQICVRGRASGLRYHQLTNMFSHTGDMRNTSCQGRACKRCCPCSCRARAGLQHVTQTASPTSSEQVHQEGFSALDARAITSHSGLRFPCGDWSLVGVVMPSQHTK